MSESGIELSDQVVSAVTPTTTAVSEPPVLEPHAYPRWILGFALLATFGFVYSLLAMPKSLSAVADLHSATKAYAGQDFPKAATSFDHVLARYPKSRPARIGLAKAYFAAGSPENEQKALSTLTDFTLNPSEWEDLLTVMPVEDQRLFGPTS